MTVVASLLQAILDLEETMRRGTLRLYEMQARAPAQRLNDCQRNCLPPKNS